MATYAGYLVAIASNRIYAQHGTLTGSIGVLLQSADVTELSKKVGVQMQLIKSAPLKGTPSIFETLTPEAHQSLQDVVNSFFDYFIALVAKERNLPEPEVRRLADGRVYTGTQALTLKLVDEIGDEEAARNWLVSQKQIPSTLHVHDVSLVEEPAGWARLLPIEPPAKGLLDRLSLMGLVSIW